MGMIGNLLRVSQEELDAYLNDSELLEKRIYNDDPGKEDANLIDIDKAWGGIMFLLTGDNFDMGHPLTKVLFSGQLIDEEQDLGYGPAHYLTSAEVAEINDRISGITTEELRKNFIPEKMEEAEIYPTIWDEGEEAFDYLNEYFKHVQRLYKEAAEKSQAVITFIN